MDVQRGFCWRCNKGPFKKKELSNCPKCSMAKYCSRRCQREDTVRHESIECPTWSPKKCAICKKKCKMECAGCYNAWYCSKDCQGQDWPNHKAECRRMRDVLKLVASRLPSEMCDYPFYFSNSFANDLLQLQHNELEDTVTDDAGCTAHVGTDFRILLPATGDLRHVVKTVQSLPSFYRGRVHFVMNDIDPFAMARNVLFFYMMFHLEKERASNITTIWMSSKISRDDYDLLQKSLSELISTKPESLRTDLRDLIRVDESSWNALREVWCGWKKLVCRIGKKGCIDLIKEKNAIFHADPGADSGLYQHLGTVPQRHSRSIAKWFEDGVIEPRSKGKYGLTYYNPTLTGRVRTHSRSAKSPSEYQFSYCVRSDCIPYQTWDYLDMARFEMADSVTEMCHAYTVHAVTTFMTAAQADRFSIDVHVEDYINLSKVIKSYEGFDRIFASNLVDYWTITDVLRVLEPFLSKENPHAVIMTETINWTGGIANALIPSDLHTNAQLQRRHVEDAKVLVPYGIAEYYNNMAYFVNYLRGDKLTGMRVSGSASKKPPTLRESMESGGLVMRDIRKELNRVVPFNRRVHARAVNMLRGDVRMLEWYRKPE